MENSIKTTGDFVFRPCPPDEIVKCRIVRERKGASNNGNPVYYLHLEEKHQKTVRNF